MEQRKANMMITASGGTSGKGGYTYRCNIPTSWAKEMGISKEDRELTLQFDGEKIIILKK